MTLRDTSNTPSKYENDPGKHCEPDEFDGLCVKHGHEIEYCWNYKAKKQAPTAPQDSGEQESIELPDPTSLKYTPVEFGDIMNGTPKGKVVVERTLQATAKDQIKVSQAAQAIRESGDGVEALDELIEDAIHMGIMSVGTDGKIDYNEVNRFKPILRAAIELLLLEARISEMEQAWDWAVKQNRSHIKGDFVLKRIRKLKALQSNLPRKDKA